jgi:hypothetical protein
MKNLIFLGLFLSIQCAAAAQTLSLAADKPKILIGEQFHLQLVGTFSKPAVTWPSVDSLAHLEILDKGKVDTVHTGNAWTISQTFLVTSWDSGQWLIPAIVLGKIKTKPLRIDVAFSPSPFDVSQPYHDVREIIDVPKPPESKWYWYLIFIVVLIALFLLFFPPSKKKEKPAVASEDVFKEAVRKLQKLEAQAPADNKLFYTELVSIFREYLHRRKNIQSFSKTTDDLAIQISRLDMPQDQYRALLNTLRLSDLVKFAKFQPSAEENKISIETIKESIITIEGVPHAV